MPMPTMKPLLLRWTLALLSMAAGVAAQNEKPVQPSPIPADVVDAIRQGESPGGELRRTFHERHPRYRIARGDTIAVAFAYTPEFNRTVTVQPDGFVTLEDVGDLPIAGKTVPEATVEIRNAYSNILRDPTVTVDLKDFEKPYFVVLGMVGQPGKYELRGETTVAQAVAVAGGFNQKSKHSEVVLFRRYSSEMVEARKINVKKMLNSKNLNEDLFLRPGDIVYVPQNTLSKIERFLPLPSLAFRP